MGHFFPGLCSTLFSQPPPRLTDEAGEILLWGPRRLRGTRLGAGRFAVRGTEKVGLERSDLDTCHTSRRRDLRCFFGNMLHIKRMLEAFIKRNGCLTLLRVL